MFSEIYRLRCYKQFIQERALPCDARQLIAVIVYTLHWQVRPLRRPSNCMPYVILLQPYIRSVWSKLRADCPRQSLALAWWFSKRTSYLFSSVRTMYSMYSQGLIVGGPISWKYSCSSPFIAVSSKALQRLIMYRMRDEPYRSLWTGIYRGALPFSLTVCFFL